MYIFHRPYYTSEATQFLDSLRQKDPKVEQGQQLGRNLLWDKSVDRDAWRDYRAAQVPQKPYVYQTETH
ncbi:MAG: DUF3460 family protein [Rhodoferax sp.]|nr:DUF3460 family protein [Rhodoferax sp.]